MTHPQVLDRYWDDVSRRDTTAIDSLVTDDFIEEWPQSGERLRGAQSWRRIVAEHPTYPQVTLRRIVGSDAVWACEADFDYGGGAVWRICSIVELRGDRIARVTQYFGQPFPPADWRRGITEPI